MNSNESSSPEELPPEIESWLANHPEADADALEEVWRLSRDAAPEQSFDPERVAAVREALTEAMGEDRRRAFETDDPPSAPELDGRQAEDRMRTEETRRRVGWTVGTVLGAALVAVVAYATAVPVRVTAPPGEVRSDVLPDGSRVELNSGTTLRYPQWWRVGLLRGWMGRSVQLDGEAFFAVTDTGPPFRVETANAEVRVLGTRFNVQARTPHGQPETRIVVAEGRVALSASGQTTRLDSAQTATVRGNAPPSSSTPVHPDRALAWRRGGFAFTGASIETISAEVERRFNVPITVQDVQGPPVTLHVDTARGPTSLLRDVCNVAGCRVDSTAEGLTVRSR